MKNSSHVMKDIGVTNKVGISDVLLFINLKVFAFGVLGDIFNNSLATEKASFRKLIV